MRAHGLSKHREMRIAGEIPPLVEMRQEITSTRQITNPPFDKRLEFR